MQHEDTHPIGFRIPQSAIRNPGGLAIFELLATLAVLTAGLGLGLGLMIESERASREMLRHEAAVQYCQEAMNEAMRVVRAAIPPAALTAAKTAAPGTLTPHYGRKELALIVAEAGGFSRVVLDTADVGRSQSALRRRALALGDTSATTRSAELSGSSRPERFEPRIRFAYATPPEPGLAVNYLDEWTSATPPALVRITIQARVGARTAHSSDLELQTAVIPGLIPAETAAASADHLAANEIKPAGRAHSATRRGGGAASSRLLEAAEPATKPATKSMGKPPAKPAAKSAGKKTTAKPATKSASKKATAKRAARKESSATESAGKSKAVKVISAKAPVKVVNRAKTGKLKERSSQ